MEYSPPRKARVSYVTDKENLSHLNDDNAEKLKRRRMSVVDELRRRTLVESPRSNAAAQQSGSPLKVSSKKVVADNAGLSGSQMADLYSSCIKLSTENKINQKNSWELGLIDYISDVLETKHGEMTNFQVASCTLDASVKIYSCRVDSIHSEAYKVLGGLTRSNKYDNDDGNNNVEENDEPVNGGEAAVVAKKKPAKKRTVNTIETNIESLNLKQHDLEFDVDPLFQKTSAAFDEGGARGLLLNHLAVYNGCELIFDSSDRADTTAETSVEDVEIDLNVLKNLSSQYTSDVSSLHICAAFKDFSFSGVGQSFGLSLDDSFESMTENKKKKPETPNQPMQTTTSLFAAVHDSDDEASFADMGFGGGFDDDDDNMTDYNAGSSNNTHHHLALQQETRMRAELDGASPSPVLSGLAMMNSKKSTGPISDTVLSLLQAGNEYAYFDPAHLRNWAGPDHWRARTAPVVAGSVGAEAGSKKRAAKEPFVLKFDALPAGKSWGALLGRSKASTVLAASTVDKQSSASTTLPEDCHYGVQELSRLFIKPIWGAHTFKRVRGVDGNADLGNQWYNYNNENDVNNYCAAGEHPVDDEGDHNTTGYTQHNHNHDDDDDDDFGGQDFGGGDAGDMSTYESQALISQPRMVAKIQINYAKTAKKVDVRQVKGSIWSELTGKVEVEAENPTSTVNGVHSFVDLVKSVPSHLPSKAAKEVSVPIAFVCLLHLANEKHLQILGNMSMDDLTIRQG